MFVKFSRRWAATSVQICSTLLIAISAIALLGYAPKVSAEPSDATNCVIVRQTNGGGQELYNRCNTELEVTWCTFADNQCSSYNNTWTIGAGASYPIDSGAVQWIACVGANSLSRRGPKTVSCNRG